MAGNQQEDWPLSRRQRWASLSFHRDAATNRNRKDDGGSVVPQTGDADKNSAHWRIAVVDSGDLFKLYIYSLKFHGNCLTLENGNGTNGAKINCATQNKVKKGQVWVVKKQN